jgi:ketosteroid isomerase-like protein
MGLLVVAAWMWSTGRRDGSKPRMRVAAGFGAAAVIVPLTGWFVVTSGEHARIVARDLVQAVVSKDNTTASALLASDCVLTVAAPNNPGLDRPAIIKSFDAFAQQYSIESNSIAMLRVYSESSDCATVHMSCSTTVDSFPYPNFSRWVLRVRRQADGSWRIVRLMCVSINNQTPSLDRLR